MSSSRRSARRFRTSGRISSCSPRRANAASTRSPPTPSAAPSSSRSISTSSSRSSAIASIRITQRTPPPLQAAGPDEALTGLGRTELPFDLSQHPQQDCCLSFVEARAAQDCSELVIDSCRVVRVQESHFEQERLEALVETLDEGRRCELA